MRGRGSTAGVWRWVVPVAIGVALVAGCTAGDPDPGESTVPSPVEVTSTPTPTPTPVVKPERPAAMDEPTTDGAIAAATYFLQLTDYAFSSGDTAPFLSLSAGDCKHCAFVVEQVDALVDGSYTSDAAPLVVLSSMSTEIRPDEWFSARLRVEQEFTRVVDSSGSVVDESGQLNADFIFAISWLGDRWRIEQVDVIEIPA